MPPTGGVARRRRGPPAARPAGCQRRRRPPPWGRRTEACGGSPGTPGLRDSGRTPGPPRGYRIPGRFSAKLGPKTILERRGSSCNAGCTKDQPPSNPFLRPFRTLKIPARLPSGSTQQNEIYIALEQHPNSICLIRGTSSRALLIQESAT